MIRSFLAVSAAALCFTLPALAETRTYDVPAFTGLDVSSGIDVTFTAGPAQSVSVENRDGKFDDIIVEVKDGDLSLKRPQKMGWGRRPRYNVTVTAPVLSRVDVSSGADVSGSGLSGPVVSISTSSGADATITGISAGRVTLDSSSGSDLTASGTCDHVDAESSSGSDIEAGDLICATAEADASSGSDLEIHATNSVRADASSGADIDVHGGPTTADIDKSSGGSVSIKS